MSGKEPEEKKDERVGAAKKENSVQDQASEKDGGKLEEGEAGINKKDTLPGDSKEKKSTKSQTDEQIEGEVKKGEKDKPTGDSKNKNNAKSVKEQGGDII